MTKMKITELKNLFTQGMVCHESTKMKRVTLYPEEIEKMTPNSFQER